MSDQPETPLGDDEITTILEAPAVTDAPFGTRLDGSAKKGPGGRPPKPSRRPARKAPGRPAGARKAPAQRAKTDRREAINGLLQTVAFPLALTQPLDAIAVATHAPNIAEALDGIAAENAQVAAALDRVLAVGPYGALFAAVMPLAVQIAHNHDVIPAELAMRFGAVPREQLAAAAEQHAERMMQAPPPEPEPMQAPEMMPEQNGRRLGAVL